MESFNFQYYIHEREIMTEILRNPDAIIRDGIGTRPLMDIERESMRNIVDHSFDRRLISDCAACLVKLERIYRFSYRSMIPEMTPEIVQIFDQFVTLLINRAEAEAALSSILAADENFFAAEELALLEEEECLVQEQLKEPEVLKKSLESDTVRTDNEILTSVVSYMNGESVLAFDSISYVSDDKIVPYFFNSITMYPNVNDEIYVILFRYLDEKDYLNFRSVCKSAISAYKNHLESEYSSICDNIDSEDVINDKQLRVKNSYLRSIVSSSSLSSFSDFHELFLIEINLVDQLIPLLPINLIRNITDLMADRRNFLYTLLSIMIEIKSYLSKNKIDDHVLELSSMISRIRPLVLTVPRLRGCYQRRLAVVKHYLKYGVRQLSHLASRYRTRCKMKFGSVSRRGCTSENCKYSLVSNSENVTVSSCHNLIDRLPSSVMSRRLKRK
jgi:hypothetical protein